MTLELFRCDRMSASITRAQCQRNRRNEQFDNRCLGCSGLGDLVEEVEMAKVGICTGCGREMKIKAKGLCASCYRNGVSESEETACHQFDCPRCEEPEQAGEADQGPVWFHADLARGVLPVREALSVEVPPALFGEWQRRGLTTEHILGLMELHLLGELCRRP